MFQLLTGGIIGFFFWKIFAGKHEGDKIERSLRFRVKGKWVHIHHWLWCLVILIVLSLLGIKILFLNGILIGSMAQGLTYRDWYRVVYRR